MHPDLNNDFDEIIFNDLERLQQKNRINNKNNDKNNENDDEQLTQIKKIFQSEITEFRGK